MKSVQIGHWLQVKKDVEVFGIIGIIGWPYWISSQRLDIFPWLSFQAVLLTTEHLKSLGRVEKRTLFVKPIAEVFRNEFVLANVLRTAEMAVAKNEPFLVTQLSQEDKWRLLTTCSNHLSSCFAPYHVFFNEARRVESYYQSAWYVFTLTCAQTEASGRWFITPLKPVGKDDVGMLRIRIVMMNEQELREIASGAFAILCNYTWNFVCSMLFSFPICTIFCTINPVQLHINW